MFYRALALFLWVSALRAHEGEELAPHDLWTAWVGDPVLVIPVLLLGVLYWRGSKFASGIATWESFSFWAGWIVLALALLSPLHPLGEELFSAHMLQHELLMVLAAPLLVLGRPLVVWLWALPMQARVSIGKGIKGREISAVWAWITRPFVAFMVHFAALWMWHVPALYDASVRSEVVHAAQHISFLASALLFWWTALRHTMRLAPGILYIFATAVHTTILGALLTFSQRIWYGVYEDPSPAWGLTALEDQQLGGLIMWVPPGVVYLAFMLRGIAGPLKGSPHLKQAAGAMLLIATAATSACMRTEAKQTKAVKLLNQYGCSTCHTIPGVPRAVGTVGPPLTALGRRSYLAGRIANTPENLKQWIQDPHSVDEQTAMPDVGVTPEDAEVIASYLYTLR